MLITLYTVIACIFADLVAITDSATSIQPGFGTGLYIGILLVMFVYGMFSYLTLREKEYLYFVLYILSICGLFYIHTYEFKILPAGNRLMLETLSNIFISCAGIFSLMFTITFFKSKFRTPKSHIWLLGFTAIYLLVIMGSLAGLNDIGFIVLQYNSLFAIILAIVIGVVVYRQGFKPAKFFLTAWLIFLVAIVWYTVKKHTAFDTTELYSHELRTGVALQLFFISFALIRKVNTYLELKNEAQELALQTAMENEQLIHDQKEILETRVKEKTLDLQHTIKALHHQREQLKEANLFKDKVFSVISHDLKSPISNLSALIELLQLESLSPSEKFKIFESLNLALKNTRHLLDNILAWANPGKSAVDRFEKVFISGLVDEIFNLFSMQAENKNIRLNNKVQPDLLLLTDKGMLMIILRNLVSNAIKFTRKNGDVSVYIENSNGKTSINVKDSGMGMTPETQKKLFKTNEHFSTRGTNNEKGTGIGLMLCKEFVEKLNGTILVSSQPEEGSIFTVELRSSILRERQMVSN
ncbi:MAG: sensor histidine kinase [Cyclobacteriaceae bacterium]|nr:sensor histidine kinase [Cyclobacteriaceae bacterium]